MASIESKMVSNSNNSAVSTVVSTINGSSSCPDIFDEEKKAKTIETAINLYSIAIDKRPDDLSFLVARSYCFSESCIFEAALEDAEAVVKADPNKCYGYFVKERALAGLKRYIEANTAMTRANELKKNPSKNLESLVKDKIRRDFVIWLAGSSIESKVSKSSSSAHASKPRKEKKERKSPVSSDRGSGSPLIGVQPVSSASQAKVSKVGSKVMKVPPYSGDLVALDHLKVVDTYQEPDPRRSPVQRRRPRTPSRSPSPPRHRTPPRARTPPLRRERGRGSDRESGREMERPRSPRRSRSPINRPRDRGEPRSDRPRDLPVNIYRFTGIRMRNIYPRIKENVLRECVEKYGRVLQIEIKDREAVITYDNDRSPCKAIQDLNGEFVHRISNFSDRLQVTFALGQNQDKYHMKNVRKVETEECHFYRTTGCEEKSCPEKHIPSCAGIDLQPWMKGRNFVP